MAAVRSTLSSWKLGGLHWQPSAFADEPWGRDAVTPPGPSHLILLPGRTPPSERSAVAMKACVVAMQDMNFCI